MKIKDLKFKLLKWFGQRCGFLGVSWNTLKDGIVTKICFSYPKEIESNYPSIYTIEEYKKMGPLQRNRRVEYGFTFKEGM